MHQSDGLVFEKFLKKHLKLLNQDSFPPPTRSLLHLLASQTYHKSALFEFAYIVYPKSDLVVPRAILWVIPEPYDNEQVACRLSILSDDVSEHGMLLQAIDFVYQLHADTFSIRWLFQPDQKEYFELLTEANYKIHSDLHIELPDYVTGNRSDFVTASQLYPERLDQAVAFISFPPGLISVFGDKNCVYSIRFWHTGDLISDKRTRWSAETNGLVDSSGYLTKLDQQTIARLREERSGLLPEPVKSARKQINEYIEGNRKTFDLPLDFSQGSAFQQSVWKLINDIPYAYTATYEDLARFLVEDGQKPAHLARAIGSACSANPLPVVVPCHRVIGKDGKLTGFNGGLDIKEYLLNHEMLGLQ